jgi:myo-inositol-1(or 4)-monophosphatase
MPSDKVVIDSQRVVIDVFRQLRPELMSVFGKIEYTQKKDRSKVTVWDVNVEHTLRSALAQQFPEFGFEGEETGVFGNTETYWLVDPIDGTSSFIRGLRYCTNMAALVHGGVVIAAVIYDFVHDELYTAIKSKGSFKDGVKLSVATHRPIDDSVIYSFSRGLFTHVREALGSIRMRVLLTMGAAGHSYCLLAEGKIDGIVVLDSNVGTYDNAPGMLIAEEAGAVILSYDDAQGVDRREFIIATPTVAEAIEHSGLI